MDKYAKRNFKTNTTTSAVPKTKQLVKQMIDSRLAQVQEVKSFDTGFGTSVDNTGSLQKVSTVPQGDTDSSRDGDALVLKSIEMHSAFVIADTTNVLRHIIVRWNQDDSSSAPAAITDVLQTASAFSPYNRDNKRARKFDVLHDEFYGGALAGPGIIVRTIKIKTKSQIAFQATATTGTGHIYSFQISDSSAITHPTLNYVCRINFTDS
jgi:hypothetical protein